ncbi:MAG: TetR/AcrR family transcriptional regulator [Polyangia bacterium]
MKSQPPVDARARLLDAAVEAFSKHGFHGTTTRAISTGAGMSPAAMYVHYASKQQLLFDIVKEGHEAVIERLLEGARSAEHPREQFVAAVRGFVKWQLDSHTRARVITYELEALEPEHLRRIVRLRRRGELVVRQLVVAGVKARSFDTESPHLATLAVMSLVIDLARWYREGKSWTRDEVLDHYTTCALRLVGAKPPASSTGKTKRPSTAATSSR